MVLAKRLADLIPVAILDVSPVLTSLINGILPVLVVMIFFAILVPILRFLAKQRRFITYSRVERAVRVSLAVLAALIFFVF
jgi:uncharacterized protein HemY